LEREAALENTCVEKRSAPLSSERLLLPDEEDEEADEERESETLVDEVLLEEVERTLPGRLLPERVTGELPDAS